MSDSDDIDFEIDPYDLVFESPEYVEKVLKSGYDVNMLSMYFPNYNILKLCLELLHQEKSNQIIDLALKYGADVNLKCGVPSYTSALCQAALNGRSKYVKKFLDNGGNVLLKCRGKIFLEKISLADRLICEINDNIKLFRTECFCKQHYLKKDKCLMCQKRKCLQIIQNHETKLKTLFQLMLENVDVNIDKKQRFY